MADHGHPPSAERLNGLPDPAWEVVVSAARGVLNAAQHAPPHLRRLRAVPDHRLRRGRSRRDLATALSGDRDLWIDVRRQLLDAGSGREVLDLLERDEGGSVEDRERIRPETARLRRRVQALEEEVRALEGQVGALTDEVDRARARARRLVEERDGSRRRADGLAARLETERARTEEEETGRRRVERERADLERRLAEADDERRRREERLRRRHEAEVTSMREELRWRRREAEERERSRRRERRAGESARRRAEGEIAAYRASQSAAPTEAARPGRPHRLPPGTPPGTSEALAAVLAAGPRLVIDGYNVTKQHRGEVPLDQQRAWMNAVAERISARTPATPTIVFDGEEGVEPAATTGPRRRVRTVFSRGRTADDEIVRIVRGLPADEPVVVITDDRELAARVAEHDADVFGTAAALAVAG